MTSIALIFGCLALSAFFSGSETALLRLREADLAPEDPERPGPVAASIRELLSSSAPLRLAPACSSSISSEAGRSQIL